MKKKFYFSGIEINKPLKKTIMKFWHIVEDSKGIIREQHICNDNKKRFSLECLETILKGSYKIIPQKI